MYKRGIFVCIACQLSRNKAFRSATIVVDIILVLCHLGKSPQLIWKWGTRRCNRRTPDRQMNYNDLNVEHQSSTLLMAARVICSIEN